MAGKAKGIAARAWRDRLQRWRASGLRVADFCQFEGVSAASLYQWRRRLEKVPSRCDNSSPPVFVPIEVVDLPTSEAAGEVKSADSGSCQPESPLVIELPGGVTIRIGQDVDDERVRTVVRAVIAETRPC